MELTKVRSLMLCLVLIMGCATPRPSGWPTVANSEEALEQALSDVDENIRNCLDAHDYHGAIRLLPREATIWGKLMKKTGKSYEGAHGFLHGLVMGHTAAYGDSQWGKIIDDSEIPYRYKTLLISSVLEERLGKGSVYWGNKDNLIVPLLRRLDFDKEEMFRLPDGISRETANKELKATW